MTRKSTSELLAMVIYSLIAVSILSFTVLFMLTVI